MSISGIYDEADRWRIHRDTDVADVSRDPDPPDQGAPTILGQTFTGVKRDIQSLRILGKPTGGTWLLKGQLAPPANTPWTSAPLPYNATITQIRAAIATAYGAFQAFVSGGGILGPFLDARVEFGNNGSGIDTALIYMPIAAMTADLSGLTPTPGDYRFRNLHTPGEPIYPTEANSFYRIRMADFNTIVYAVNLGYRVPPLGTTILARRVQDRYVFSYG